jgi:hypothetical protein
VFETLRQILQLAVLFVGNAAASDTERVGSIRSGAGKDRHPERAIGGATRNTLSNKLLCFIPFCSCLGQSNSSIICDGKDFLYT